MFFKHLLLICCLFFALQTYADEIFLNSETKIIARNRHRQKKKQQQKRLQEKKNRRGQRSRVSIDKKTAVALELESVWRLLAYRVKGSPFLGVGFNFYQSFRKFLSLLIKLDVGYLNLDFLTHTSAILDIGPFITMQELSGFYVSPLIGIHYYSLSIDDNEQAVNLLRFTLKGGYQHISQDGILFGLGAGYLYDKSISPPLTFSASLGYTF
jgi:hypothetical protein